MWKKKESKLELATSRIRLYACIPYKEKCHHPLDSWYVKKALFSDILYYFREKYRNLINSKPEYMP